MPCCCICWRTDWSVAARASNRAYNGFMKPQEPSGSSAPHSLPPQHFARHFSAPTSAGRGMTVAAITVRKPPPRDLQTTHRELGLSGAGHVRVNSAGCLGRCQAAPVAVVYPEGVWYRYADLADIDENRRQTFAKRPDR